MKRYVVCAVLAAFLSVTLTAGISLADDRSNAPSIERVPIVTIEPVQAPPSVEASQDVVNYRTDLSAATAPKEADPGNAAFFDIMILRPAGALAFLGGTIAAALSLPLAIPTGSTGKVMKSLVVDPFAYTFYRPVGKIE